MNGRSQTLQVAALIALFTAVTGFTIAGFLARTWLPPAASAHGGAMDNLIRYLLLTTGAVFVIGHGVLVGFLWQFGRGQPTGTPRMSPRAERFWSIAPVIGMAVIAEGGVIAMGLPVWEQIYGEPPADAVVVEATARQFEWYFRYPGPDGAFGRTSPQLIKGGTNPIGLDPDDPAGTDDILVRNRLRLPMDRAAVLRLRSMDVLHSFSVPAFRAKQDIVPGMTGRTQFVPTALGTYEIGCAELCGMGHYRMRATVEVISADDYGAWLDAQAGRIP